MTPDPQAPPRAGVPSPAASAASQPPATGAHVEPGGRGFLFDANRCTGCAACSLACSTENALGWGVSWRQIVPFNPERSPGVPSFHLSLACNHCDDAPCVAHCPTGAMRRDPVTGAVLVDEEHCIGCRYCAWVCPYDAPRFDATRGVMTKCTLCRHRLTAGAVPACVEACPTDALGYGPLMGEARLPGFPEAPVRPRIRFAPLRRGATPPESTWSLPPEVLAAYGPDAGDAEHAAGADAPGPVRLTFRGEWPLWLFTSGLAGLVGWVGAAFATTSRSVADPGAGYTQEFLLGAPTSVAAFLGTAALLLGLSTLHLGRPLQAWRALANTRSSALAREIAGVGAFLAAATLWLGWGGAGGPRLLPGGPSSAALLVLGGAAAALGLTALATMDRVYRPVRRARGLDSADTLLTGPMVGALLLRSPLPFTVLAALKLGAVLAGGRRRASAGALVALRAVALAAPLTLWWLAPGAWNGWALLLVAATELGDRARFYRELTLLGPRGAARRDSAGWTRGSGTEPAA